MKTLSKTPVDSAYMESLRADVDAKIQRLEDLADEQDALGLAIVKLLRLDWDTGRNWMQKELIEACPGYGAHIQEKKRLPGGPIRNKTTDRHVRGSVEVTLRRETQLPVLSTGGGGESGYWLARSREEAIAYSKRHRKEIEKTYRTALATLRGTRLGCGLPAEPDESEDEHENIH